MATRLGVLKITSPRPIGTVVGNLEIVGHVVGKRGGTVRYQCVCICGARVEPTRQNVDAGRTTNCNICAKRYSGRSQEIFDDVIADKRLRALWSSRHAAMLSRCGDPRANHYADYGGRGITVAPEWHERRQFLSDVSSLPGWDDEKRELDRTDNNRGYSKENCRMATRSEQNRNKRNNRNVAYLGHSYCAQDFWKKFAPKYLDSGTVSRKIREGLTGDQIIDGQRHCRGPQRRTCLRLAELWHE